MSADPARPACPDCGYDVFGIREMRCPECGRARSIRDFNPDYAPRHDDARRYERDGALGGVAGIIVLLLLLAPMVLLGRHFVRSGLIPAAVLVLIGVTVIWLVLLVVLTGRSFLGWFRARRW